jgi:hypothetical protein
LIGCSVGPVDSFGGWIVYLENERAGFSTITAVLERGLNIENARWF